jgi:putative MATE family efflux protein
MGAATGTIALVARATGARQYEEANRAAGQSIMVALFLGGLSGVVGMFLSGNALGLLQPSPDVVADGVAYLRISLLGSFTAFVLFIGNSALQGAGDALTPTLVMVVANVLNIALDPIFIYGSPPVPAMGVRGAALATVLAQACAAVVSVRFLFSGRTPLHVRFSQWRPDPPLAWRILRIGIPGAGQMFARSLMSAVMMRLVAACGTAAVAAYGIGMRFHMIMLMPAFALGGAAATMVGQGLGANKPERAQRAAWLATGIDVAVMAVAATVLMTFAPTLIGFFNSSPDVVHVGAHYLRIVSPFYVFTAAGIVFGRALNGAGDTTTPMIVTVVTLWGVQVPLAIVLSHVYEPATQGIWYAISAAMLINGVLLTAWFQTGRWKHRRV